MTAGSAANRWHRVEEVLAAALECDTSARAAFLDAACGDDVELRREVESLLAAHEQSGVLDRLAGDVAPLAARLGKSSTSSSIVGRMIGRYRVLERVAGGGMGVVYRAVDERLDRAVALKFLHPRLGADDSAAERFRLEARAIAALEHPNVCTVHEIGETDDGQLYLVMPLYDGETLQRRIARGRLPVDDAVTIAVQIARGLAKAHDRGIVHRDIKPSNVLVTDDGVAKILDFGIAKLADVSITGGAAGPLGTVAYMSPEQGRGAHVDQRTDIWSLGVVLYEMLAAQRPFDGGGAAAVMEHIQHAEPSPLATHHADVPPRLERVIARSLAKSPDERYQTARELERELLALGLATDTPARAAPSEERGARPGGRTPLRPSRRVMTAAAVALVAVALAWAFWPAAPARSIAVLPFLDMSPRGDNQYFSDGITEEVITQLSTIPTLKVISRTSAMRYKRSTKSLQQIAEELSVAHVLEGSVRREGDRIRITAQLIAAGADHHLWSRSYDRNAMDVIAVQDEIAREVSRALEVELGGARGTPAPRGTRDPQALELYRRGRFLWAKRTKEGTEQAIEYYRRAIERDSAYADPYSGLADAYLTAYQFNLFSIPDAEVYSRIKSAAERAVALDDRSAEAHKSFAVALWWRRDWPGAERELRRAIELNPSVGRAWYALLLSGMGRLEEALEQHRRAEESDPYSHSTTVNASWLRYVARDYDGAIEQSRKAIELNDAWAPTYSIVSIAYSHKGMHEEATRAAAKAVALGERRMSAFQANLAYVLARAGKRAEAERFLKLAKTDPWEGFNIARAYVALGEPDSAFAWLDRSSWKWPIRAIRADPALDPLRSDPRFARLVRRVDREMGMK